MSVRSDNDVTYGGSELEDQLSAALRSTIKYANDLQSSLDDVKDNTKRLFWWTSTLVTICLGLFLLAQLVRLRNELTTLIRYQELFRIMWDEDREKEDERIEEQRREKQLEERRRQARLAARGKPGGSDIPRKASPRADWGAEEQYALASQHRRLSTFGTQADASTDIASLQGADRDEWVRKVASVTQGLRREYFDKRDRDEQDGNDEEGSLY
ncbi:hypothetical protein F5Y11DRAFT_365871 [Daldinia sp. FL1419]|nr:hypothetical protein F5Y11DRAFT_365871 [Daldinia sp. FL1419]